jgi:hypothetical protein
VTTGVVIIDGIMTRIGDCAGCGMAGLLRKKPMIPPTNWETSETDYSEDTQSHIEILDLCITCFNTPAGCLSENLKPIL